MIDERFVILGAIINLAGSLSYVIDTVRGKVQPNRATWVLWSLAPMLAFAGELSKHVGLRSIVTFMAGFMPMLILAASFFNKKSVWKLEPFDYYCGGLSLLGLIFWVITGEGNLAIIFGIIADLFAALPTLKKSFLYPETENYLAFVGAEISAVIGLLVIDDWSFANWGFPMYVLLICGTFIVLIKFKLGKYLFAKK